MQKQLPINIEAEEGVLGSIIIDAEALVPVNDFLHSDDFYRDAHKEIYRVMLALYSQQIPADFITICDELERRNQLEQVGGASYITSLINQVPTSGNAEFYAGIVSRTALLRRLIHAAGQIAAIAYEENNADVALEKAEQLLYKVSEGTTSTDLLSLTEVMSDFMADLDRRNSANGQIVGLSSGFDDLDFLLGGFQPGEMYILGGHPGEGKTSLLLNILYNILLKQQKSVAMFSIEMSKRDLARRLVSMDAGINSQDLRNRTLNDDMWNKVIRSLGNLSSEQVYVDESSDLSITALRSKCRRHKTKHGLDLVIVDYLQLMSADSADGYKSERRQEIDRISRGLKGLAKELDVPVLACASLNRAGMARADKTPQLSDLRESGNIGFDADVVMFIRRSQERSGYSIINIEKHRNGPTGDVTLRFDASVTRFYDVEEGEV